MKLLFHCCCAPCAAGCLADLAADPAVTVRLFWYNPNIHPYTEYKSRRDAFAAYAALHDLETELVDEYGLRAFIRDIGAAIERPARCEACYRLRLEKTAAHAAAGGCDAFSTSLLVSPYQDQGALRTIGEELAAQYGLAFLCRDFRPRFREGQARARSLGLYMQKYCGCIFSEEERYLQQPRTGEPAPA